MQERPMMDQVFYLSVAACSFVSFLVTFLLSSRFSNFISETYEGLPPRKKVDWDSRYGSNIHAIIVTTIAIYIFLFDKELSNNTFSTDGVLARCGISITFGYILADFVIMMWYYRYFGDAFTVVHHLMALWAYIYVVRFGYLLFYANIRQIAELSTVFVNERWYLDTRGKPRHSPIFIANGLVMAFTFFAGRITFIPYFFYKVYSVWSYPERIALGPFLSFIWVATSGTLDVINIYWFRKMLRGAMKLLNYRQNKVQ